ncbi:hypothetical protein JCM11251_004700 [Rhodosporidiobolus azoricus]
MAVNTSTRPRLSNDPRHAAAASFVDIDANASPSSATRLILARVQELGSEFERLVGRAPRSLLEAPFDPLCASLEGLLLAKHLRSFVVHDDGTFLVMRAPSSAHQATISELVRQLQPVLPAELRWQRDMPLVIHRAEVRARYPSPERQDRGIRSRLDRSSTYLPDAGFYRRKNEPVVLIEVQRTESGEHARWKRYILSAKSSSDADEIVQAHSHKVKEDLEEPEERVGLGQ